MTKAVSVWLRVDCCSPSWAWRRARSERSSEKRSALLL